MNYAAIANVLGKLLIVTGSSMVFPLICSMYYGEDDLYAIAVTGAITVGLGLALWRLFRSYLELNIKDGFFMAVFGWIIISALSGLPFMIHGSIPSTDFPGRQVDSQICKAKYLGFGLWPVSAKQSPDPSQQLIKGKRLDQVVIGSRIETCDPVWYRVLRCEHQNRYLTPFASPQAATDL